MRGSFVASGFGVAMAVAMLRMAGMEIGALFDWDGVIIDSARQHEESWELLARELGAFLPAGHFKIGFGRKNEAIIADILGWSTDPARVQVLSMRKEELYRELVIAEGTAPLPGVREFLERLRAAGVPSAIGSSTHLANIETIFAITGLARFFDHVVAAEDVTVGKPDPQVFLLGAERIARAPGRCIVFEDALAGLQAAYTGGMCAVAVATTHPVTGLEPWADRVVTRLDELDVADLEDLVRHRRRREE